MTEIVWTGLEEPSHESCRIKSDQHGVTVVSDISGGSGACSYRLQMTEAWEFITAVVHANGHSLSYVSLNVDGKLMGNLARTFTPRERSTFRYRR